MFLTKVDGSDLNCWISSHVCSLPLGRTRPGSFQSLSDGRHCLSSLDYCGRCYWFGDSLGSHGWWFRWLDEISESTTTIREIFWYWVMRQRLFWLQGKGWLSGMLSLGRNWDLLWAIKMSWEPTSSKNVCEKETVEERNVKNMVSFWTSCLFFFSSVGHACQKLCSRARETQRGIQGELHCTLMWCITQFKVLQHLLSCLILPIGAFWAPTIDKKTGFLNIRACLESYLVELGLKICFLIPS